MDIVGRLQKILTYSNLSVRALAIKCSLKQQTLDKHIKGIAEPSANTLISIASAFPEISTDWLLLGNGVMLKEDKETDRVNSLIDTISILQDTINAKSETIALLTERIKQLENQLNSK
ncbi:MAG: helix-turn-helix domain-containing protein [Duncaniella sp.]|nr:helix-turn-helix domain-containing protein [Duncaniella sp.]